MAKATANGLDSRFRGNDCFEHEHFFPSYAFLLLNSTRRKCVVRNKTVPIGCQRAQQGMAEEEWVSIGLWRILMPNPRKPPSILIEPVQPADADPLLGLYAKVFHKREPLMRHMGFSEERMASLARLMHMNRGNDSLDQGLWWLARDASAGGAPVGFAVCGDILEDKPEEPPKELTPQELAKVPALIALLEEIRRPLDEEEGPFDKGECLHISALGVTEGYEGFGIATRLLDSALARGAEAGFRIAASISTGEASRRCHEKSGFRCLHSVRYSEFQFDGTRPFSDMEGQCHLMRKDLLT